MGAGNGGEAMLLNVDAGEGIPGEEEILPHVDLANVACGAHAGSAILMRETVRRCQRWGVQVGAHPGWPDPAHFGRRPLPVQAAELAREVAGQVERLGAVCREEGVRLGHVKLHGALYHQAATDPMAAAAVLQGLGGFVDLVIVAPPGSLLLALAREQGREVLREGFADRRYALDGQLLPRTRPGAVLLPEEAGRQAEAIRRGRVPVEGGFLPLQVDTLCLHGDSPAAAASARVVRERLTGPGFLG